MSMKKKLFLTAFAAAVSTSAVSAVSASQLQKSVAIQQTSFVINDAAVPVRAVSLNGVSYVSLRDLGTVAGIYFEVGGKGITAIFNEHMAELRALSREVVVDGSVIELKNAIENINNAYFITLEDFTSVFGAETTEDEAGQVAISTIQMVKDADRVVWIDSQRLLASVITEDGRVDYVVNAATGAYTELMKSTDASDLVVSPNGQKAAYTLESGAVYTVDLASKQTSVVTSENSIKPELVWSADSSAIYFLQGDKGSVIAKLNLADGTITKVLEDKVDYKSNLSVSADGTKFYYTVIKPGAVTADASKPVEEDNVAIDMTGTEPQIIHYDAAVKDGKPSALTTTNDDKIFVGSASDGSKAFYVSVEEGKASSLISIAKDKTAVKLIEDKDVLQAVMAGDKIYAVTDNGSNETVYEVDTATGAKKELYTIPGSVTELLAASGTPVAVIADGQVSVNQNGTWKKVTH
ncbi:stalk domain-containing protein [Paenibacillus nasutitermitis]|uniref:Copper amine oxidase-like N-terminal domain-containing protein n=1 Tax=Paenibacillus nasutitermitis TaxID=1652958 RepID=A0A916YN47_9BACL|nr:hypothetical protein [Paenibacillus nasutitermitis]GGD52633.1 hypothetical protein GCM10010911_07740 [Paenibacillus nasutitermitis]